MKKTGFLVLMFCGAVVLGGIGIFFLLGNSQKAGNKDIVVEIPKQNEIVTSPLEVRGKATGSWFFEAQFPIEVLDADGNVLGRASARAEGEWMTPDLVPFTAHVPFETPLTSNGTVRIMNDNPSDLPEHAKRIDVPVLFSKVTYPRNLINIKAFFGNSKFDPEALDCAKVFPVERLIPKTQAVAEAAIQELLTGPGEEEKQAGYFTSLPPGVKLQGIILKDGIISVDFSDELDRTGGSCRVIAIRSQIMRTLKQFSTVKDVRISVDGRTEDILQP